MVKSTNDILINFPIKPHKNTWQNKFVKKICKDAKIEFTKHEKEKKNENKGSLFNLFESEMFDIHYALYYLDIREETGVVDVLINLVYKRFINQSFFYLPQLW